MADSQRNLDHSDDAIVEPFFDLDSYYGEAYAEPDSILDSEVQAPKEPRLPSQNSRLEFHQGQANSSEVVSSMSLNNDNEIPMADVSLGSLGEPSKPATRTGNQPLQHYEQPSRTDSPNAEIVNIDARIQEIDLILERRELQKRRHTILQGNQGPQQAQASERPGLQIIGTASDSRTQLISQRVTSGGASQGSNLFPTGIAPFSNNWVDHSYYDMSISPSGNDPSQNASVGTDFPYNMALTDPLNSGVVDLAHRGSSHFEILEQSSQAGIDLSNTDSVHLPNYMPARLPSSEPNNHCGTRGPVPGLGSDQTTMQSPSTESQRKEDLNLERVQHVSALSSSQHDRALHNSETSISNRKRLRSPQPTKVQHLSAIRRLAKNTGVPETSLNMMCFNSETPSKRRLTESQKRNMMDVKHAGGPCYLCQVFKKKCSGQRPCDTCRGYWQNRAYNSTSFMWTCDVQSKLRDIDIFSHSLEGIPELKTAIDTSTSDLGAFLMENFYLLDLLDYLEQSRAKFLRHYTIKNLAIKGIFNMYICTHDIVRWKRTLVYLVPKLHRQLAFIENLYRSFTRLVLHICDRMDISSRKNEDLAIITGVLVFDEMENLTKEEKSDPSAVDHLQLAFKARLKVLCSRIFDKHTSERKVSVGLIIMINRVPELSFCLPPAYQNYADVKENPLRDFSPLHVPDTPLNLSACLLRRSDSNYSYYNDRQIDGCCCGWAFDSIRPSFLGLFGYSAQSFARYIHSGPQKISLGDKDLAFDPCQAINAVLGGSWIDDSSLRKSMIVFASILSFLVFQLFTVIECRVEEQQWDPEMAVIKDRLDRIAKHCRPQFFALLLRSALAMYPGFWNSIGKIKTHAESSDEVWTQVLAWLLWVVERHACERNHEFVDGIFDILNSSMAAETTESDDPDQPSNNC